MSSSQFVASLRVDAATYYFSRARTGTGRVPDVADLQEEELSDPGIDGVRYREIYRQFQVFTMETLEDWSTRAAGDALAQNYQRVQGRVARMTYIAGGVTKTYAKVKIVAVQTEVRPGPLVGFGASSSSLGTTAAVWSLRVVEV